ncbi:MAG: zinc ribbon domain-containing protein [Lachnospiraceae bacterium]|nr:zinc ribbon domain-containing protein [Lachnospiraceae bacterium]
MKCPKCEAQIADNSKFCPKCGEKIEVVVEPEVNEEVESQVEPETAESVESQAEPETAESVESTTEEVVSDSVSFIDKVKGFYSKNSKLCKIIGVAAVALIVILVLALKPKTVDLNDYVEIEVSGYDGIGVATATFDYDKFERDYYGKIKLSKSARRELESSFLATYADDYADSMIVESVRYNIDGELDKSEDLSNGDKIVYQWDIDESDLKRDFKNKFKYKDIEYKVKGLEKISSKDVFKDVEVTFEGTNGDGSVNVKSNNDSISFYVDGDSYYLKNGDEVTVVANIGDVDSFANKNGYVPKQTSKKYKVEGLGEYISSLDDLNEKQLEALKSQANDEVVSYMAQAYSNEYSVADLAYAGGYVLKDKDGESNEVYVVMKGTVSHSEGEFGPTVVYFPVNFDEVYTMGDEVKYSSYISLDGYSTIGDSFYSINGYVDGAEMYNDIVTSNVNNYTYKVTGDEIKGFGQ